MTFRFENALHIAIIAILFIFFYARIYPVNKQNEVEQRHRCENWTAITSPLAGESCMIYREKIPRVYGGYGYGAIICRPLGTPWSCPQTPIE